MGQAALLSVSNLSWAIGKTKIIDDVNFKIKKGAFVGLIGPNGAGKSSLMRCIYRVNQPSSGTVLFEGNNVWETRAKDNARNMAVILQEQSDHMGLSVYEVVALGLTAHKKIFERDTLEDKHRIEALLTTHHLAHLSQRLFSCLSGGEKQRVMLARAILQQPKLLIMDEPTNHLDVHYQIDVLRQVKQMSLSVFASFHNLNLAAAFCDHVIVLNKGGVYAQGTPSQVLTEDLLQNVFQTKAAIDRHPGTCHPRITYDYCGND